MSEKVNFNGKNIEIKLKMTKFELKNLFGLTAEQINTVWENVDIWENGKDSTENMLDTFEEIARFKNNLSKITSSDTDNDDGTNAFGIKFHDVKPLDPKIWKEADEEIDTSGFDIDLYQKKRRCNAYRKS